MTKIALLLVSAIALVAMGTGCRTYKTQSEQMVTAWAAGDTNTATRGFVKSAQDNNGSASSIIWHLEAGAALRTVGDFKQSNAEFETAAIQVDKYEAEAKLNLGKEVAANFSNQQNLPYKGRAYDKIMLHTYRALNYLAMGEADRARPELIRAYQRQEDAVQENAKRIEKAQDSQQIETEENKKLNDKQKQQAKTAEDKSIQKAKSDPKVNAALDGVTKPLENFKFYSDYVNPFTVYLDGLYFLYAGSGSSDLEHATKSLRRVAEVFPDNKYIQEDLKIAESGDLSKAGSTTYVIFETGRAVSRDQLRIDIPIIVVDVSYVGAAFPKLEFHPEFPNPMTVKAGSAQESTLLVSDMDSVIALDFKNEWPTVLTKTLVSTISKAVATYFINEAARQAGGDIAGWISKIGTAVYGMSVNVADTRTWTTLPKQFQVAKIPTPAERKITVSAGGAPSEVSLVDGKVNVVYVKAIGNPNQLFISQFKLQ